MYLDQLNDVQLGKQNVISRSYEPRDRHVTFVKARALLEGLARGERVDTLADELAAAALDDEVVQLALAVAAGDEYKWRRAIELACAVLSITEGEAVVGENPDT